MTTITAFLQLIRWKNLGLLSLSLFLLKYQVFPFLELKSQLNQLEFLLFILSILSTAAAGNTINDIFDIPIDAINKPTVTTIGKKINLATAKKSYILLLVGGILSGFAVCIRTGNLLVFPVYILTAFLLYYYSKSLKKVALLGNFSIALLLVFPMLLLSYFEQVFENTYALYFVVVFAIFAFVLNLLREIIKDQEDIDGDHAFGLKTLPILIGQQRTVKLTTMLGVCFFLFITFVWEVYINKPLEIGFYTFGIILPYMYFLFSNFKSKKKAHYRKNSLLLKLIMSGGLILLFLLTL